MEKTILKVFDSDKAKVLIDQGVSYCTETINGKNVYNFFITQELINKMGSFFNKKDFLLSNKLSF